MRELKFRAWSNEHNRYCNFVTLDENGRWVGWIESSGVYLTTTDIVLEQYTGLKDKNGKEIYEGDIIRVQNGEYTRLSSEEKTDGSEVVFEWGAFKYLADNGLTKNTMEHLFPYNLEVIGNIHENKELLK